MNSRRKFISKSSSLLTAGLVAPKFSSFSIFTKTPSMTVNLGIIGTGSRGMGLMKILNAIENVTVTAICDTLSFRLTEAQEICPKAKSFSSYKQLLEYKKLDGVIISTPLNTHATIASDAIDADLHIYCEKTMVKGQRATLDLVSKVAKEHNKIFQTGHQYHSSRLYSHVVEMIQGGKIGKITAVNAQWNRNGDWRRPVPKMMYERQVNWRMYREFSYGLLAELSSHQIDFVNWVTQLHPEKVAGFGGIDYWKDGRETYDNIHVIYSYPNGLKASFTCLTANAKDDYKIRVFGDKGTIVLDYYKAWEYPEGAYTKEYGDVDGVSGATANWEPGKGIPIEYSHLDPTRQALEDFRDAIVNEVPPISDITTGAKTAVAIDMGIRAMDQNKTVYWDKTINL